MKTQLAKHTPGPWIVTGRYIGVANHKSFIGECRDHNGNWCDDAMANANAKLIAAAPEMLAGLIEATDYMARLNPKHEESVTVKRLRAIIAKAGGAQ